MNHFKHTQPSFLRFTTKIKPVFVIILRPSQCWAYRMGCLVGFGSQPPPRKGYLRQYWYHALEALTSFINLALKSTSTVVDIGDIGGSASSPLDPSRTAWPRPISRLNASNHLIWLVQVGRSNKSARRFQIQHDTIKYWLLQSACMSRFIMPHTSIGYCRMAVIGPGWQMAGNVWVLIPLGRVWQLPNTLSINIAYGASWKQRLPLPVNGVVQWSGSAVAVLSCLTLPSLYLHLICWRLVSVEQLNCWKTANSGKEQEICSFRGETSV